MPVRLLIAQHENVFAELLGDHLERSFRELSVQTVCTVRELSEAAFDVAIIDLILADGDTLEWLRAHTASRRRGRVMILTSCQKDLQLHSALRFEVAGCVHKDDSLEFLKNALRTVFAGGHIISPRMQAIRARLHDDPNCFAKILSDREQIILAKIGAGYSAPAIAKLLGIAPSTVLDHRKNLMAKLDLHSSVELYAYAVEKGFTSPRRLAPNSSAVGTQMNVARVDIDPGPIE